MGIIFASACSVIHVSNVVGQSVFIAQMCINVRQMRGGVCIQIQECGAGSVTI